MFYSVNKGHNTGVYNTWDECKEQIFKYKNAKYKKFKNLKDAEYFKLYGVEKPTTQCTLEQYGKITKIHFNQPNVESTELVCDNPSEITVYTDGSCINNGKTNIQPKAGIGIYFGVDDPRNVSEKVIGKQTNNVAEITAIIHAISMLRQELEANKIVNIYTDSKYSIKCCTTYGLKLEKKNWTSTDPIPNLELVRKAYNLCKLYKNVRLHHVKAHSGKKDIRSIGNYHADRLANESVL